MLAWLGKLPNGDLRALDDNSLKRLAIGECYQFEFKIQRNIKFHRKFFAFLTAVHSIESIKKRYVTIEHLRYVLTIDAGYFEEIPGMHGEIYIKAKSIAFANMEEADFGALYTKMLNIMLEQLPNHTAQDIRNLEESVLKFY